MCGLVFIDAKDDEKKFLSREINDEDMEKLKKLISVVYGKIINLDFPDVSYYPKSYKGIHQFIEDLIAE